MEQAQSQKQDFIIVVANKGNMLFYPKEGCFNTIGRWNNGVHVVEDVAVFEFL